MSKSVLSLLPHFLVSLFFSLLFCLPAFSAETPNAESGDKVIIVLDASGSMWGQIESEPKMAIAKQVVNDLIGNWDENVEIGLTVYGHRRKADCSDIEAVVPVGQLKKQAFVSAVTGLSPKGKTPLTAAVRKAAEELKYNESRATVILVSDGIETCDEDPCAVAAQLEEAGVDFTAHVIGFDINTPQEIAQLKCVADKTGGKFLSAKDAGTLKSSLEEAVKEVAKVESGVELVAVYEAGGPAVKKVQWSISRIPEDGEGELEKVVSARVGGSRFSLDPGAYRVSVKSLESKSVAQKDITVAAETLQREEVIIPQDGKIALKAVLSAGGDAVAGVHWELKTIPENDLEKSRVLKFTGADEPVFTLLPGRYLAEVKSTRGKAFSSKEVEVVAGKLINDEVIFAKEGIIKLSAVTAPGGKPLDKAYWELKTIPVDELEKPKTIAHGRGATPEYKLLPGKYLAFVKSLQGKAKAQQEVEVVAGKRSVVEVLIAQEGMVELSAVNAQGGPTVSKVYWTINSIVPADSMESSEVVTRGKGSTPSYKLLPGKYLAKVKSLKGMARAEQEIEVVAGKKRQIEVILPTEGKISLAAVSEKGGKILKAHFSLFAVSENELSSPTRVHTGGGSTPTYLALPGRYLAVAQCKGREYEKEVQIVAGKLVKEEVLVTSIE